MSLQIQIDHKKLVDSPYDGFNHSIFEFTTDDTEDLVQDILNGNKTCYLISGYRGTGKSSFVNKLSIEVKNRDDATVFITLNFAKYELKSIILRKLIRSYYLQLSEKDENKTLYSKLKKEDSLKVALEKFNELYERTFYDVSKNSNQKKTVKSSTILGFNVNLKDLLLLITPILAFLAFILKLNLNFWYNYIPILGSAAFGIFQFFSLEKKKIVENENADEKSKNSFYDDEIAEYYIIEILQLFKAHINPIFILDELDKINDVEMMENLINELKPLMISGLATFIVVAGQGLFYNYYEAKIKDDNSLTSLFSRIHHISLSTSSELRVLFDKLLKINRSQLISQEAEILDSYINYLILDSLLIPRRFIILIRQNITWQDEKAFLEISESSEDLNVYSKFLFRIEKTYEQEIDQYNFPSPIRDYFKMQLVLAVHKILRSQNKIFTEQEIISKNGG